MPQKLKQYLNRTILVSIPALFEDGKCRAYTLQSIEEDGLWLSSNALAERLLSESELKATKAKPLAFVQGAQIAAIILPPPQVAKAEPAAPTARRSKSAASVKAAPSLKAASK